MPKRSLPLSPEGNEQFDTWGGGEITASSQIIPVHINGNKSDNRISNLRVMDHGEHSIQTSKRAMGLGRHRLGRGRLTCA